MEIIPINSGSVKICLSLPDMKELNVTCSDIDKKNTGARRALRQIIDKVKDETGFDAAKCELEVRMMRDKSGGCELFIRKTDNSGEGGRVGYIKENYRTSAEKSERADVVSYIFDSLDMMCGACRQLLAKGFSGDSRAYYGDDGKYYLIVGGTQKPTSSRLLRQFSFLSEFGQRCEAICADSYIMEHFKCICDGDAVKIIAENC